MSLYVLDTDTFSLYHWGYPDLDEKVDSHPLHELAIMVILPQQESKSGFSLTESECQAKA
jgi:hypothetical protein